MLESMLTIVAVIAGVAFVLALHTNAGSTTAVYSAISLIGWGIVAFEADNVVVVTETGTTVTQSAPSLQYLGLALAVVSALGVITGFVEASS